MPVPLVLLLVLPVLLVLLLLHILVTTIENPLLPLQQPLSKNLQEAGRNVSRNIPHKRYFILPTVVSGARFYGPGSNCYNAGYWH